MRHLFGRRSRQPTLQLYSIVRIVRLNKPPEAYNGWA
jgi:hypothetical protein